jgi:TetR/AcrR family transcriptional repressor of mexJK operon
MSPATAHAKPNAPGRPKDLGKRAAILEAAKRLFVEQGYDGVSMDEIAAGAGVSKLTVYSHFGDKEALFMAAIAAKCEEQLPARLYEERPGLPLREQLLAIGRSFFGLIMCEEAIAIHRVVTAQRTSPKLGRLFWDAGPCRTQAAMEQLLREAIATGALDIPDVHAACAQLHSMLKGEPHIKRLCGFPSPTPDEAEAHLQVTVDMFLRAYARR